MEDVVARRPAVDPLARDLDHVLVTIGTLWEDLRSARIFVTGGTGFFGCWLLETVLWASDRLDLGVSIVVLTRDGGAFRQTAPHLAEHSAVTLHAGDVRTFTFPAGAFTHVLHLATSSATAVPPDEMFDTIVGGTRRTLEFARQARAQRFLLASSGAVYGTQPPDVPYVDEDYAGGPDPTAAGDAYGEGKRAAEILCAIHAGADLSPTIARCFAFVGPYLPLDAHFAVGNFIRDAMTGGPIRIAGDGTPFRSYLYAADLAIWLWTILLRGRAMHPYNVGSEVEISIRDLAEAVARQCSPAPPIVVACAADHGPPHRYVPSTARARHELGLKTTLDLDPAIARTVAWHRVRSTSIHVQG